MKTILAPIDFSPVTRRVVRETIALSRCLPARVVLFNVTSRKSAVQDHAALETLIARYDPRPSPGHDRAYRSAIHGDSVQVIGEPVTAILKQARKCCADYIVMGSHGHTALFERMLGSTTAGVIGGASCPVMLVPARTSDRLHGFKRPVARKRFAPWLNRRSHRRSRLVAPAGVTDPSAPKSV